MDSVVNLTSKNFKKEVKQTKGLVLVDFWASWCGTCKAILPIMEEFAKENIEKIKVCELNVEDEQDIASEYGVLTIPTLILFKDGKKQKEFIGYTTKEQLEKNIEI
ncbi:MAG: thioredoxin [bacterium]